MRSCRPRAWSMITSRLVSDSARSEEPASGDGHSELVELMIRAGGSMVDAGSAHPPIVDLDPNLLLGPALLLLGVIRVGLFVRLGARRLHQSPRPQPPLLHHVDLGSKQGDLGSEIDPGKEPDHDRERTVGLARTLQLVAHVVAAQDLKDGPCNGADDRPRPDVG